MGVPAEPFTPNDEQKADQSGITHLMNSINEPIETGTPMMRVVNKENKVNIEIVKPIEGKRVK